MTGQILIIDAVSTNRIVLKARLASAFYVVTQAATTAEALRLCRTGAPDLIIIGDLPRDVTMADLIHRLDLVCPSATPPVLVLAPDQDPETLFSALRAGATDVLGRPVGELTLLARLRALIRQRRLDCDLLRHLEGASPLGLAEDPAQFAHPGRVAVLAPDKARADILCRRLDPLCRHELLGFAYQHPDELAHLSPAPDTILFDIDADHEMQGMRLVAEWQAAPAARHMRLIALLDKTLPHLAVPLLDLGACDVVDSMRPLRDLALRLDRHVTKKKRSDGMRGRVKTGLQAAMVDPLTSLHNRRYAETYLRRMISQASQGGESFAIMLADLDHFKRVNDTYGHAAGDRVLARVAKELRQALPSGAMIARVGGEEFLIAVPDIGMARVKSLAERLGQIVRETPVTIGQGTPQAPEQHIRVTVSIGVTLARASPEGAITARTDSGSHHIPTAPMPRVDELIAQADQALYASKSCGRDTVTLRSAA